MDSLPTKIALITGGGSGINLSFAQLLHTHGVRLLLADLALHSAAQKWLDTLPASTRSQIHFQPTDVTRGSDLKSAFDACESRFGGVPGIVVAGAGIYEPGGNSFWGDEDEDGDEGGRSRYTVLDVNLVHPIKLTRLAVRRMLGAGKEQGVVICLSSVAGQGASVATPLYVASKHGVNSFVRSLAVLDELVGIRIAAVAPGAVMTPLWSDNPKSSKYIDADKDVMLPPEEVARAMFALVTDKKYKSGTVLEVCDVEGRWREAHLLNDPGPQGPATTTSRKQWAIKEVVKILNKERGLGGDESMDDAMVEKLLK